MLLKSPATRWTPKPVPRQKTTSAAAAHRILKPTRTPNPARRWITIEIQTATSGIGMWTFAKYFADPSGTAKYFANVHIPIPDVAVWISIVIHLLAGLGVLVGFKIRWAAAALVVFCLGTGFGVHLVAGDFNNMIHFYKNLVMAGGFLYVMAYGAGAISIDGVDAA